MTMTQEEMDNAILNIQETLTGMKADITGLKEEGRKRDEMLSNVQNTLLTMQQENQTRFEKIDERFDGIDTRLDKIDERFDGIDTRLDKIDNSIKEIVGDVSDHINIIFEKMYEKFGTSEKEKFKSKSHMQILEEHEDRISKLESEKVANQ